MLLFSTTVPIQYFSYEEMKQKPLEPHFLSFSNGVFRWWSQIERRVPGLNETPMVVFLVKAFRFGGAFGAWRFPSGKLSTFMLVIAYAHLTCVCTLVHDPLIVFWIFTISPNPIVLCHSASTPGVCNGSQLDPERWHLSTGDDSKRCSTVSERSLTRATWGKFRQVQIFLTGKRTSSIWSHTGLHDFWSFNWPKPVWFLPPTE